MTDRPPLPPFFWMSFVDRIGREVAIHLGITIVEAHHVSDAAQVAWDRGCNPGGEVCGMPLPDVHILPRHLTYRLLDQPSDITEAQIWVVPFRRDYNLQMQLGLQRPRLVPPAAGPALASAAEGH